MEQGHSCQHIFGRVSGAERASNVMFIVQGDTGVGRMSEAGPFGLLFPSAK